MFLQLKKLIKRSIFRRKRFKGSEDYWNRRYLNGGNSGSGSYGNLAEFKAEVINDFVEINNIDHVIEFGCGDGNQLKYMRYPSYVGFDVSSRAIHLCREIFRDDNSKMFKLMTEYDNDRSDLTLSLEVIFHLIEDDVFHQYMNTLFKSSNRYVIIYSSNTNTNEQNQSVHVRHRRFTDWIVDNNVPFVLTNKIDNQFPFDGSTETSFSDFYFYEKTVPAPANLFGKY